MGLFSFLTGGKKKAAKAEAPVEAFEPAPVVVVVEPVAPLVVAAGAGPGEAEPAGAVASTGAEQVKLRLRLAASLRKGQHDAAYEAARGLADIQAKAGRRLSARVWTVEADRILEQMAG